MPNFSGLWSSTQQFQAVGGNIWPSLPGAPTIGTASVASGTSASVTFTAPEYTGYPAGITGYTVTSSPDGLTGTGASSPITVTGLTTGTAYTFTVKATNATGTGPSSAASNSITPPFTYVEDVFSTTLYTGNDTVRTITNDIALVSTAAWQTRTLTDGTTTTIRKIKKDTAGNYITLANSTVSSTIGILLIKFDSAWNITWQKRINGGSVGASALTLDTSDNIYVGYGDAQASLAKFDSSGSLQWARNISRDGGGNFQSISAALYNTVDGFLYIGGRIGGGGTGGGPGLYAKYSTAGVQQWMYRFKPDGTYYGNQQSGAVGSMAHDSTGNVYFCGSQFAAGWQGNVVKINSSGTFQWQKVLSSAANGVEEIHIDSSDGIYVCHWDSALFNSSGYLYTDAITTKLDTSGAIVWNRKFRSYPDGVTSLTGDASGNVYTALGRTLTKHNSSGTLQWSRRLFTSIINGLSIIDSTLYVTGVGTSNGFITELAPDGTTTSGNAYHTITTETTDAAGSTTISNGSSSVVAHTGTEQAASPTVTTASTTAALYTQAAVTGFGGLTWLKSRSGAYDHGLFDTVRGATNRLTSSSTAASSTPDPSWIKALNANGFTLNTTAAINNSGTTFASWTFRKQPKFFDIVTWTHTGGGSRAINHSLGSTPGMIIVVNASAGGSRVVWHRSAGTGQSGLYLQKTDAFSATNEVTSVNSSTFTLSDSFDCNGDTGATGIAYVFAHDAGGFGATGTDSIISCGSYTGNGSATGPVVNLGYEPQWVLIKEVTQSGNAWSLYDNMRGLSVSAPSGHLRPNASDAEDSTTVDVRATSTGFQPISTSTRVNRNGETFIYMAIRKGPMKTPTDATKVFSPVVYTGNDGTTNVTSGFPVDFMINKNKDSTGPDFTVIDRLRGFGTASDATKYLFTNLLDAEGSASNGVTAMGNDGITLGSWSQTNFGSTPYINWMFRRAPGFFDEVCYTGAGVNTINHNLGVVPELIIVKKRSSTVSNTPWVVYSAALGNDGKLTLNDNTAAGTDALWDYTTPTTTVFSVRNSLLEVNYSGATYVAYLFATCAGVSKVGSYTGTGTTLNVDCGFTAGARFVLIKRTNSTGNWFVWDTARGIVSGNDPYLRFDDDSAEVTNTDYIDPYSPGFTLSSTAPAALNASGGSYIFLAIA
jgi:hypothetical protein